MSLKIIELKAENFKRLEAVDIKPNGNLVMVTGANGAGKSSVLDAIEAALCGERSIDRVPIKKGKDKGGVKLDFGDFTVTRSFTKSGSYLRIENKDGFTMKGPQAFLDKIVGKVSFDPLEFINMKDKKAQRQTLLELVGLNIDDLQARESQIREERLAVGRNLKEKKGALSLKKQDPDAPETEISLSELSRSLQEATEYNAAIDTRTRGIEQAKGRVEEAAARINAMQRQIADVEVRLESMKAERASLISDTDRARELIQAQEEELSRETKRDIMAIQKQILEAEDINKRVRSNREYSALSVAAESDREKYDELTAKLEGIEAERVERFKEAEMPIPDLSVDDTGVLFRGVPLEQAGDGEKLVVGLAISMAMNPKLHVLRIKDGSLLDEKNLSLIEAMIRDRDYQLWIEKVDESGKLGIFIEEGEVKAVNEKQAKLV